MNFEEKEQIDESREFFFVSQKVVDIVMTYNQFSPASQYIKSAEMENRWPNGSMATQSGHVVREIVLIDYGNYKTLEEFIENSRDIEKNLRECLDGQIYRDDKCITHPAHQFWFTDDTRTYLLDPLYYLSNGNEKQKPVGLSHLIIDDKNNRPIFIQDVYNNEEKYPFLIKKFDSSDFNLKYNVKIFEIDYEKFYEWLQHL